jgi:nucleoside-diphosphate-sugar epimerase
MKSVLVTGATGFVGRHTLPVLLDHGFEVHALFSQGLPVLKHASIHWHEINLHDTQQVEELFQQISPSHLLHLAWYAKPKEYWTSPLNIEWVYSSIHLLNAFIKARGQRAVLTGTCAEYDWQQRHCKELSTPCLPVTLYGRSKYALHLLTESLAESKHLSLAWARLFFLFGAHEYPERLIPSAIDTLLKQQPFEIMNGNQIRDFLSVNQVAHALVALLDSDVKGPVNIASGQGIKLREIIDLIADKLNAAHLVHYRDKDAVNQASIVTADVGRLQLEVRWQPQYSLENELEKTISWWSRS